jgi:hypothetical protein
MCLRILSVSTVLRISFAVRLIGCCASFSTPGFSAPNSVTVQRGSTSGHSRLFMSRSSKSNRKKGYEESAPEEPKNEVWIGINRGQQTEFKMCQQCKRPMNRRARWKDDATWAAVKYCSDKCRGEAKRRTSSENI